MDFEKKVPEWDNVGAEPDAQLKKEGFKAGYKPPAAYFNWFFNRISEVAKELQEKAGNEIDNKPDASGGDISDTVITSAEEPKDDYPVPAAGDSTKVFLGKTRKFFGDIKNWMTGVCLLGQIVNNCVTDNAKLPLSAAQGKALMDLYNVLNTNTKWASFETVKDSEFTVEFAKCGAIAFVSVIRDNNGSENVDKQIEYPDKYKPFHKISVSNYSSDKEAFIELDTKLRIYAVQGHWVRINIVYPVQI